MVTQGFPQLVRVSPDVVQPDDSRAFGERRPVICQVRMINEYAADARTSSGSRR